MATFTTTAAVDFRTDFNVFLTTLADEGNYQNVGANGFDAVEPGQIFPDSMHVDGSFLTVLNAVVSGPISSMALHKPFGLATYTFGGVGMDFSTLHSDLVNHGPAFALADMLKGNDVINGSASNDVLYGFAGADKINGAGGNDIIRGGLG